MSTMHPRVSLSAISTFGWDLDADLTFYERAGVTAIGASLAKLDAAGIELGARRIRDAGLRVTNLIGIGPFRLDDPGQWDAQRDRVRVVPDQAQHVGRGQRPAKRPPDETPSCRSEHSARVTGHCGAGP